MPATGDSGEFWRTRALAAERELQDRDELAAIAEQRKEDAHAGMLAGLEAFVRRVVAEEVARVAAEGRVSRPDGPTLTLRLETPAPFHPVALGPPILPPAVATAPVAPPAPLPAALPPMLHPPAAATTDTAVEDMAAKRIADRRLLYVTLLAPLFVTLAIAIIAAVSSHYTPTYTPLAPSPYIPQSAPGALPRNPLPPMVPHT